MVSRQSIFLPLESLQQREVSLPKPSTERLHENPPRVSIEKDFIDSKASERSLRTADNTPKKNSSSEDPSSDSSGEISAPVTGQLTPKSDACTRCELVLVNVGLLGISLFLFALGCMVLNRVGFMGLLLEEADAHYRKFMTNFDIKSKYDPTVFGPAVDAYAYTAVVIGAVLGSVSMYGIVAAYLTLKKRLVEYVVCCIILVITEFCQVIYVYTTKNVGKRLMYESLLDFDEDVSKNKTNSAWDVLMVFMDCCGVEDYEDFHSLTHWPDKLQGDPPVHLLTPLSCCKGVPLNVTCAKQQTASPMVNNMNTGCYNVIFDAIFYHWGTKTFLILLFLGQIFATLTTLKLLGMLQSIEKQKVQLQS